MARFLAWWRDGVPDEPRSPISDADADRFLEQARWLMEWHNKRGEGAMGRAATLLAFHGAVLALLVDGAHDVGGSATHLQKVLAIVVGALVLAGSACCVLCLWPRKVYTPGVEDIRDRWAKASRGATDPVAIGLANTLLYRGSTEKGPDKSPVLTAATSAGRRMLWFQTAAFALFFEIAALVALGVAILEKR